MLQSVERFGPAGHERLLIQGSLTNTAPLGTAVQLDFYASAVSGQQPAVSGQQSAKKVSGRQTASTVFSELTADR